MSTRINKEFELLSCIAGWAVGSEAATENQEKINLLDGAGYLTRRVHHTKNNALGTWISYALTAPGLERLKSINTRAYKRAIKQIDFYKRTGSYELPADEHNPELA